MNTQGRTLLSGRDRIFHVENVRDEPFGHRLLGLPITPQTFPRLSRLASAYQKIKYNSLSFEVVPRAPTTVSGGYVAGFVPDSEDVIPSSEYLFDAVSASPGATAANWWDPTTVRARPSATAFYTSVGEEVRLYSPGIFYLVVEGVANTDVPVTVYANWSVELSMPSLESIAPSPAVVTATTPVALNYANFSRAITNCSSFLLTGTGNGSTAGTILESEYPEGAIFDTGRGNILSLASASDGAHSTPQLFRFVVVAHDSVTDKRGYTPLLMLNNGETGVASDFPDGWNNVTGGLVLDDGQSMTRSTVEQASEWHRAVGFRQKSSANRS